MYKRIILLVLCLSAAFSLMAADVMTVATPSALRAEYQENPLGIDVVPQLSWQIGPSREGLSQTDWQVLISSSPERLAADDGDLWDSGKVSSNKAAGILPQGLLLESRRTYYWKVRIWNGELLSGWSEMATFETGLLHPDDWWGGWIGYVPGMPGRILYFKASNHISKKVVRARAYVAGLGYSDFYINHRKVGDHVLDPAQSTYSKRVYYVSYDIAPYLQQGGNSFVVSIAPGWLGTQRLRAQVEITYDDGSLEVLNTDRFRSVTTGPTVYSTVFDGEEYDARQETEDLWKPGVPPGMMDKQWAWAHNTDDPVGAMVCQQIEPIKVVDTRVPVLMGEPAPGVWVFDAGRNLAGWVALKAHGKAGEAVTLKFAETIYDNGLVNQENLRNAKVTDRYIFKGEGTESWEPAFTYHGFRYFQVEGLSYKPSPEDFIVKVVRSSVAPTGMFHCSDSLLNSIHEMVRNTESNNLHSVPTDCPQRDERMGWLNDLTVRIEQAIYNFDMSRFYAKFIKDVSDTQDELGRITCVAPFRFGMRPASPVSASYLIMAEKSYEFYGNRRIIADNYEGMKAWTDYLASRTENGVVQYSAYNDWCAPYLNNPNMAESPDTPGLMMSTGYLFFCESLISRMAAVLGLEEDARSYADRAAATRAVYNREWWNEEKGGYYSNNQACNSFALWLGMPEADQVPRVVENLARDVREHDYHLTTGNLCTKYLMEMLTEHGHVDEAYRIASQTTYPSWGFMLANGATSLWERWENLTGGGMNSHDHPMMGSVGSWFYKYLVGITPDWDHPGFEHFTVKPYVPKGLASVEGSLETVRGKIAVSWKKQGSTIFLDVDVPGGATATVYVPSRKGSLIREVGSGHYRFKGRI